MSQNSPQTLTNDILHWAFTRWDAWAMVCFGIKLWYTTGSTRRWSSLCFVFLIWIVCLCFILWWRLQGQKEDMREWGKQWERTAHWSWLCRHGYGWASVKVMRGEWTLSWQFQVAYPELCWSAYPGSADNRKPTDWPAQRPPRPRSMALSWPLQHLPHQCWSIAGAPEGPEL